MYAPDPSVSLKAEKAAAEERNQRIDTEYSRQRKEAQEMELARQLTVLFYQENIPDRKALNEITRHWTDRSRAESWTDEMKEQARQKQLERSKRNG